MLTNHKQFIENWIAISAQTAVGTKNNWLGHLSK